MICNKPRFLSWGEVNQQEATRREVNLLEEDYANKGNFFFASHFVRLYSDLNESSRWSTHLFHRKVYFDTETNKERVKK